MARKAQRLEVVLSPQAQRTLRAIWAYNEAEYGEGYADRHLKHLRAETEKLVLGGRATYPAPNSSRYRFARLRKSRSGRFHIAIFEAFEGRLVVVDFVHTAQDWTVRYADEES